LRHSRRPASFTIYGAPTIGTEYPPNPPPMEESGEQCSVVFTLVVTEQDAGVLDRKLSQLIPLSYVKRVNPRYFIMFCGISCELAGRGHCLLWTPSPR
jgi:hypothetical protein